jgi:hypothetical protein
MKGGLDSASSNRLAASARLTLDAISAASSRAWKSSSSERASTLAIDPLIWYQ